MTRGFLSGLLVGGVVSVGGLTVISLTAPPPSGPDVSVAAPDAGSAAVGEIPATTATASQTVANTGAISSPGATALTTDQDDPALSAETAAAPTPPELETATLDAPSAAETPEIEPVEVTGENVVYPNTQAVPPAAPASDVAASEPAEPPASGTVEEIVVPEAPATGTAEAPQAAPRATGDGVASAATTGSVAQVPAAPQSEDVAMATPSELPAPVTAAAPVETTPPAPTPAAQAPSDTSLATEAEPTPAPDLPDQEVAAVPAPAPQTPAQQTPAPEAPAATLPSTPAQPEADAPDPVAEADPAPESPTQDAMPAPTQTAAASRPTIGRPATSLLTQDRSTPSVVENDAGTEAAAAPETPLEAFAVPFDASDTRPRLSIVLMDTGSDMSGEGIGVAALGSFPYQISFAVAANLPDAADRAAIYRAQGWEVLALVDLPDNLTAADTEVALSAAIDAVPEAVGVLEGPETGLQGSKEMSDQVTAILSDTGHGIVWQPKGLDTAQKLAAREGVASRTLFRDFDSAGQKPVVIRRFLDQGAFKAGQQDGVIMVGRVRPDTISALLLWGLQDRAQRVAVAPVSAVLVTQSDG